MFSRVEIRDSVLNTTRQPSSQIGSLVEEFINITLAEINYPGWAFPRRSHNHLWNFLKRKTSFTATAESYVLGRYIDKVLLARQTASPVKIEQITDEQFYRLVPNPTATGNPRFYRLWEEEGVAVKLAAADTIDVVSDSSSDAGSSTLAVSVAGYDSNGIWRTETYQLNGTTTVSGSITFAAGEVFVSKQKDTTGTVTVTENSGGTTLTTLGPKERAAKFKVIYFYPIPSSTTIYIEYLRTIPPLENDSDVPLIPENFMHVVRLGALAKVYQYLNKEQDFLTTQSLYAGSVRAMVSADKTRGDLIEHLSPSMDRSLFISQRRSEDAVA